MMWKSRQISLMKIFSSIILRGKDLYSYRCFSFVKYALICVAGIVENTEKYFLQEITLTKNCIISIV